MRLAKQQLADVLKDAQRNLFGSLIVVKDVTDEMTVNVRGTGRGQNGVKSASVFPNGLLIKQTYRNISQLGVGSYQNSVNNARIKAGLEADFESEGLPKWQETYDGSYTVVKHKEQDKYYLRLRLPRNCHCEVVYFDRTGRTYTYEQVEGVLPSGELRSTKEASNKATAERQGVPDELAVKPRIFTITNIVRLAYGGEVYECSEAPTYRPSAETEGGEFNENGEQQGEPELV